MNKIISTICTLFVISAIGFAIQPDIPPVDLESIHEYRFHFQDRQFDSSVLESIEIPDDLKEYVFLPLNRKGNYIEIFVDTQIKPLETLNPAEALEDIKIFKYILETAYSGKEYWEHQGIDFQEVYDQMTEFVKANGAAIPTLELFEIARKGLSKIIDGHFSFALGRKYFSFYRHHSAYFADVLVQKEEGGYTVIRTGTADVKVGSKYTGPEDKLFPTLAPREKKHFLIGTLSNRPMSSMELSFNGVKKKLFLHRCNIGSASFNDKDVYFTKKLLNIPVVRVSSFSTRHDKKLKLYSAFGKKLRNADAFILNICSNGGGSSTYSRNFVRNFNTVAHWWKTGGVLNSTANVEYWAKMKLESNPEFIQKMILNAREALPEFKNNPRSFWKLYGAEPEQKKGDYKGRAAILINSGVASSGEGTIAYCKSIPGHVLIGENSAGIGNFGEVLTFVLPHSGLKLRIPSKLFIAPGVEEGVGYLPDYWLDSSNPEKETVKWIKDPENYQFEPEYPDLEACGFEYWNEGLPQGFKKEVGISRPGKSSRIEQDTSCFTEGRSSLKISGDLETPRWWYISKPLPASIRKVTARFDVKAENIHHEGNQFKNNYVGFSYRKPNGKYGFQTIRVEGSFDWKAETVTVSLPEGATSLEFCAFLSMTGELWIDRVSFTEQQ